MIRIQIRSAMMGAMAFVALAAISFTARAADPVKLESIDVQTLSGQQVQLKLHMERSGSRATAVHHRQAGAHCVRPAEYHAGSRVAPLRRALGRCRHRGCGRGQRPHAPGRQCRRSDCPTPPRSTATTSSSPWAQQPGAAVGAARRSRAPPPVRPRLRSSVRSKPSISGAVPTAPAA